MTNLRLPGQYDERLLGSLGLQGPYYNWNRWYLPGVGRYLELDPVAMAGRFNGDFGPDWYSYASGNPLKLTDPTGEKPFNGYNYCGPGDNGGPPTNCVDSVCQFYDACYDKCHADAVSRWLPQNLLDLCLYNCDKWSIILAATCKICGR